MSDFFLNPLSQNIGYNNVYFNTVSANNLIVPSGTGATGAYSTKFPAIQLMNESNQILFGPSGATGNTILNVPQTLTVSQYINIPDGATGTSNIILSNGATGQAINTSLALGGNVYLQTSGNTPTALNYYATGIFAMKFIGIWATFQTCNIYWARLGNIVTLYFSQVLANATSASFATNSGEFTNLPSYLIPTQGGTAADANFAIIITDDAAQYVGLLHIFSNGVLNIYSSNTGTVTNFSGSASFGTSGWTPFSISYVLG